jgi:hypothetical protein
MAKRISKYKNLREVYEKARGGDEQTQRTIIGTLENLGCDHLATKTMKSQEKWSQYWDGLSRYIDALCSEYGVREDKAEKEVLAEINGLRGMCDDVQLTEGAK